MKKTDRNMKHKPWSPMTPFQVPVEAEKLGVVAAFQNHRATVFVKETTSDAFTDPAGQPQRMAHLLITWAKGLRGDDGFFYRMKQHIKSELCGPQAEYVELGPGAWREMDVNHTHLWVLPQGATYPLGLVPSDIESKMAEIAGGRENVVTKADLEVFVVRHPEYGKLGEDLLEVFGSEEECKEMYGDSPMPDGSSSGMELIGDVPSEAPFVAWSDLAKKKLAAVMAKSNAAAPGEKPPAPDLFYDKDTVEDDVCPEAIDDEPSSLEEHLAVAGAMKKAAEGRENSKVTMLRKVTDEVTGKASRAIEEAKAAADKPRIIVP